jgi:hypothetical protein
MKTSSLKSSFGIVLLLLGSFIFYACNKPDDSADQNNNQFQWTHKGVTHTTNIYDTAYITSQGLSMLPYMILAGKGLRINIIARSVLFHLSSFNVATYTIGPSGSANVLYFQDDAGNDLEGVSGTLVITSNSNNRMTGNFSVTVRDASLATSQLTGSFTDMPIVN